MNRDVRGRFAPDTAAAEARQLMLERMRYEQMPARSRSWIRRVLIRLGLSR